MADGFVIQSLLPSISSVDELDMKSRLNHDNRWRMERSKNEYESEYGYGYENRGENVTYAKSCRVARILPPDNSSPPIESSIRARSPGLALGLARPGVHR